MSGARTGETPANESIPAKLRSLAWLWWSLIGVGLLLYMFTQWQQAETEVTQLGLRLNDAERHLRQLEEELKTTKHEAAAFRRLTPVLDLLGPNLIELRTFEVKREVGQRFTFGKCPSDYCAQVTLEDFTEDDGVPTVVLRLAGEWGGVSVAPGGRFIIALPLLQGCASTIRQRTRDLTFVVLDDRALSMKIMVAATAGTFSQGVQLKGLNCEPAT